MRVGTQSNNCASSVRSPVSGQRPRRFSRAQRPSSALLLRVSFPDHRVPFAKSRSIDRSFVRPCSRVYPPLVLPPSYIRTLARVSILSVYLPERMENEGSRREMRRRPRRRNMRIRRSRRGTFPFVPRSRCVVSQTCRRLAADHAACLPACLIFYLLSYLQPRILCHAGSWIGDGKIIPHSLPRRNRVAGRVFTSSLARVAASFATREGRAREKLRRAVESQIRFLLPPLPLASSLGWSGERRRTVGYVRHVKIGL